MFLHEYPQARPNPVSTGMAVDEAWAVPRLLMGGRSPQRHDPSPRLARPGLQMRSLHMFPALTSLRLIQQVQATTAYPPPHPCSQCPFPAAKSFFIRPSALLTLSPCQLSHQLVPRAATQGIQHIEGLDRCTQLQKLWLPENRIRSVGDGVAALSASLRELYLYSNRLTSMTGLAGLSNLEILWLSDNHISRLEGLGGLPRLKELSLARNCICSLAEGALAGAPSGLRRLNLADNALASLQEVAHLTCLPALDDLCLADPAWGECPVATLCNYQAGAA